MLLDMDHLYRNLKGSGSELSKLQGLASIVGQTSNHSRLKSIENVLRGKKKQEREAFFHKKINKVW